VLVELVLVVAELPPADIHREAADVVQFDPVGGYVVRMREDLVDHNRAARPAPVGREQGQIGGVGVPVGVEVAAGFVRVRQPQSGEKLQVGQVDRAVLVEVAGRALGAWSG